MATWTVPKTWLPQDAVTGPLMNSNVRDNIKYLAENRYIEVLLSDAAIGALPATLNVTVAQDHVGPILVVWASCFTAATGLASIALQWDGAGIGPIGNLGCTKSFNEIGVHQVLNPFAWYLGTGGQGSPTAVTAGAHTLKMLNSANATCDSNDHVSAFLIGL